MADVRRKAIRDGLLLLAAFVCAAAFEQWFLAAFVVVAAASLLIRYIDAELANAKWSRQTRGVCLVCGYDLRGSRHACICPECGRPFELYARVRAARAGTDQTSRFTHGERN